MPAIVSPKTKCWRHFNCFDNLKRMFSINQNQYQGYSSWSDLEFRENIKILTVLTDNVFDQNHFGHHYVTLGKVLVQSETIDFSMKKSVPGLGKIRILKEC